MWQQLWTKLEPHWHELGVISYSLIRIWMLRRQARWQVKLLEEQRLSHIASQNETVRIMSTAYASGEPVTLADLLSSAERDWSLRSAAGQSASDDDEPTELRRDSSTPSGIHSPNRR
jgi:hypothetical protein